MNENERDAKKLITGLRLLEPQVPHFDNPIKDVFRANLTIVGCAWVETTEGVVLIDTLNNEFAGRKAFEKVKGKIKYIIYTHGHGDHVGGARAFISDNPKIIANKYLPDRFDKYKMLAPHRGHITAVQFNMPDIPREANYVHPTDTFLGEMKINLGDKTFELYTERAETDDIVWVFVPELNAAFIGDLMIGSFPNIGNPWKPTRFALDWAKALEKIRAKEPYHVFCNGASYYYRGKRALAALDANIEVIRSLHDQVVKYINEGMHITEMIHRVKIPEHLERSPYLKKFYSRPEFFVYNVYRWYHGYFDDNPAHLIPCPEKKVIKLIFDLIGNDQKIIDKARELCDHNQFQLSLQVLDVLLQANPEHIEARKLRIELVHKLGEMDYCYMSRNAWVYYANKDIEFLKNQDITL
ncbi:MAG: MBL fold metallo-hydrolase [Candidatus Lokiarchaeota archaeon]|nr:MBL fold metallo-hydrolase [Candidatus Lokiarchaeota archaeon]